MSNDLFYNNDQKLAFISDYDNNIDVDRPIRRKRTKPLTDKPISTRRDNRAKKILQDTVEQETLLQKDLSLFTKDELDIVLVKLSRNVNYKETVRKYNIIKSYFVWCYNKGYIDEEQMKVGFYHHVVFFRNDQNYADNVSEEIKPALNSQEEFIFATEDEFVDYILTVMKQERYYTYGVILILVYYGFSQNEIVELLKTDVVKETQTVKNIFINNKRAFDYIYEYKNIDGCVVEYSGRWGAASRRFYYAETKYLVRVLQDDANFNDVDRQFTASYIRKATDKMRKAVDELPPTSPYKNIYYSIRNTQRLSLFHKALQDESKYGSGYVKDKLERKGYSCTEGNRRSALLTKCDYAIMKAKI